MSGLRARSLVAAALATLLVAAAPGVSYDLRADEGRGHTIASHVGKTDAFLRGRLTDEQEIERASTFDSLEIAERAVAAVLRDHAGIVAAWAARQGDVGHQRVLRLDGDAGFPAGRVLVRGASAPVPASRVRVILCRTERDSHTWFVRTAYPELQE